MAYYEEEDDPRSLVSAASPSPEEENEKNQMSDTVKRAVELSNHLRSASDEYQAYRADLLEAVKKIDSAYAKKKSLSKEELAKLLARLKALREDIKSPDTIFKRMSKTLDALAKVVDDANKSKKTWEKGENRIAMLMNEEITLMDKKLRKIMDSKMGSSSSRKLGGA